MPVSKDALDAVIGQPGSAGRQARWAPAAAGNSRAGVGPSNPSGTAPALKALVAHWCAPCSRARGGQPPPQLTGCVQGTGARPHAAHCPALRAERPRGAPGPGRRARSSSCTKNFCIALPARKAAFLTQVTSAASLAASGAPRPAVTSAVARPAPASAPAHASPSFPSCFSCAAARGPRYAPARLLSCRAPARLLICRCNGVADECSSHWRRRLRAARARRRASPRPCERALPLPTAGHAALPASMPPSAVQLDPDPHQAGPASRAPARRRPRPRLPPICAAAREPRGRKPRARAGARAPLAARRARAARRSRARPPAARRPARGRRRPSGARGRSAPRRSAAGTAPPAPAAAPLRAARARRA